jgi:hypothetical protein
MTRGELTMLARSSNFSAGESTRADQLGQAGPVTV